MNRKANGHNADYVKRLAKKIKKSEGITYLQALNKAASNLDFYNWKHFVNLSRDNSNSLVKVKPIAIKLPNPLVLPYFTLSARNGDIRPNARMPITMHQEIGSLLKALFSITEFHKRAQSPISRARNVLDDWVQQEYQDHEELPNQVFFRMYYGDVDARAEYNPSPERKQELIVMVQRAQRILKEGYHECRPVRLLNQKLDRVIKALGNWPSSAVAKAEKGLRRKIPAGTYVHLKVNSKPAVVISNDIWNSVVECYGDSGSFTVGREEISVYRDQSKFGNFSPKRLSLPYGKWTCNDGIDVLFNRDYCPIWVRNSIGVVVPIDLDTQINYIGTAEFYFDDASAPYHGDKVTLSKCTQILEEWGVLHKESNLMKLLNQAIETGNTNLLRKKSRTKTFPEVSA